MTEMETRIRALRVVPVLAVESVDSAIPLADALIAGGLPVAEITFRTAAAADVIRTLSRERPQLLVGAGTVTTPEQARAAKECGAAFALAPGLNPRVIRAAQEVGLPFIPGVMTPTEIESAIELGLNTLKFFPAGAAGGVKMLSSLYAPYAHLGIQFVPTGGISPENLNEWLAQKSVLAVGGSWLAKKTDISEGRWDDIVRKCREAVALAAS